MRICVSTIFLSLAILSCNKSITPPGENETVKIINDFFYPKDQSLYSFQTNDLFDLPPEVKQIKVLKTDASRVSDRIYHIVAVVKGRLNIRIYPPQKFIDTIFLELRKTGSDWKNQNMTHRVNYSLVDTNYRSKF